MSLLQLFRSDELGDEVRTLYFDWYVCGELRMREFELWWGREESSGKTLPNLTLTPKTVANGGNVNGAEIIDSSWLRVQIGTGAISSVGSSGINLGNLAINSKISLSIGLETSSVVTTVGPIFFKLDFSCDDGALFYADFQFGVETYSVNDIDDKEGLVDMNPILVSATLFDLNSYEMMRALGFKFPRDAA